jgi:hypothetical protein
MTISPCKICGRGEVYASSTGIRPPSEEKRPSLILWMIF